MKSNIRYWALALAILFFIIAAKQFLEAQHGFQRTFAAFVLAPAGIFLYLSNVLETSKGNSSSLDFNQENKFESLDTTEQIKKLSDLKDQSILTEEEFQSKKKDLLDKI